MCKGDRTLPSAGRARVGKGSGSRDEGEYLVVHKATYLTILLKKKKKKERGDMAMQQSYEMAMQQSYIHLSFFFSVVCSL